MLDGIFYSASKIPARHCPRTQNFGNYIHNSLSTMKSLSAQTTLAVAEKGFAAISAQQTMRHYPSVLACHPAKTPIVDAHDGSPVAGVNNRGVDLRLFFCHEFDPFQIKLCPLMLSDRDWFIFKHASDLLSVLASAETYCLSRVIGPIELPRRYEPHWLAHGRKATLYKPTRLFGCCAILDSRLLEVHRATLPRESIALPMAPPHQTSIEAMAKATRT